MVDPNNVDLRQWPPGLCNPLRDWRPDEDAGVSE